MTWVTAALVGVQQRVEKMSGNGVIAPVPQKCGQPESCVVEKCSDFLMFGLNRLSQRIVYVVRSVFVV